MIKYLLILLSINSFAKEYRQKIGIVDTGIILSEEVKPFICEDGLRDFTDTGIHDYIGHGTNIAGILTKDLSSKDYCLVVIKYVVDQYAPKPGAYLNALAYAYKSKLNFLNLSLNGRFSIEKEKELLNKIGDSGTIISVASGNDSLNLSESCNAFPSCYAPNIKNMYVVSAKDVSEANIKGPVNSYQTGLNVCGFGICLTGTSQATAVFLNKMIRMGSRFGGGGNEKIKKSNWHRHSSEIKANSTAKRL